MRDGIKKELNTLFGEINLVNEEGFVNLDHLWHTSERIPQVAKVISEQLSVEVDDDFDSLIIADKIKPNFGILPFGGQLSQNLSKDLIIWKEYGNFLTGTPQLFGHIREGKKTIIVHDVVLGGMSISKMLQSAEEEGLVVLGVFAVVCLLNKQQIVLLENELNSGREHKIKIKYLVCDE